MPQLTKRHVDIVNALYNQNKDLAEGSDDQRRLLTRKIAEQICFEFGSSWGTKSSSPTNPPSKDAIAVIEGSRLYSWDWQNGATREPQVSVGQEGSDITGQFFIEVEPINHLNSENDDNEDDDEINVILKEMIKNLEVIHSDLIDLLKGQATIMQSISIILSAVGSGFPDYELDLGFLGKRILKPKP